MSRGQGLKEAARIGHHSNANQNWTDATVLTLSLESSRGSRERECTYSTRTKKMDSYVVLEAMYNPVTYRQLHAGKNSYLNCFLPSKLRGLDSDFRVFDGKVDLHRRLFNINGSLIRTPYRQGLVLFEVTT